MDPESAEGIEFRNNVLKTLKDDLNLVHRVVDLEEKTEVIDEILTRLFKAETKIQVIESYGHVTGRKLNEARAKALTKHFQEMKLSTVRNEKSMTSGEMISFFEDDAPEFLRIWELKNPHKTVSDIRNKCLKLYPQNYTTRKSKHGKRYWLLIFKD